MTKYVCYWQRELHTQSQSFLFLLKQSLTSWEGLTHPSRHSLPPHLLCLQVPPACHIHRAPPGVLSDMLVFLLRIANCTSLQFWHWGWAHPLHLVNLSHSYWAFTFLFTFPNSTQSPGVHNGRNTQLEGWLRKKLGIALHHRCPNPTGKDKESSRGWKWQKKGSHISNKCKSSKEYDICVLWRWHLNLVCFAFWSITWLVLMTSQPLQLLSARTHLCNALLK